jgi:hypothetical protein
VTIRLTRQQLYDLVWSEAMKRLAAQVGISDVAIAKTCRKVGVPIPERGYWNKLQAGHKVARTPLPATDLATIRYVEMSGTLTPELRTRIRGEPGVSDAESEPIEVLTERFRKRLGHVAVPQTLTHAHPAIARLLAKDEEHRQRKLAERYYWHSPQYETPLQRRRLRILNALFLAFERVDVAVSLRGYEELEAFATLGGTVLPFAVARVDERRLGGRGAASEPAAERLVVRVAHQPPSGIVTSWVDAPGDLLEGKLSEVAVGMAVAAELLRRQWAEQRATYERERREEAEREARRRAEEAERRERQRRAAEAQARIDALLEDADALEKANRIRAYVAAVLESAPAAEKERFVAWAEWALAESDRIDPVASGKARTIFGPIERPTDFE